MKLPQKDKYKIGVISDTHGLLRPDIPGIFKDVDMIIHAGDIGGTEILNVLNKIAPVAAVRGNMDSGEWAKLLPVTEIVALGNNILIYVLHSSYNLDIDPNTAGFRAIISGHTHQPSVNEKNGVLFLNPGSAGPRRHDYPISVALLFIQELSMDVRIIELEKGMLPVYG